DNNNSKHHRALIRIDADIRTKESGNFVEEPAQILSRADAADRAGEDVVKDQRRNREAGHEMTHRVADDDINAAANEHAAAFHVDRTDGETEQHHAEN